MKKITVSFLFLLFGPGITTLSSHGVKTVLAINKDYEIEQSWEQLIPEDVRPEFKPFYYAVKGYWALRNSDQLTNIHYLTIIDFSLASSEKRLWVVDMRSNQIVERSLVSHGKNSGLYEAHSFSNIPGSHKSSLGFYLTGKAYEGKHGYSLRLTGLEKGINDNAEERAIVIHSASYATKSFVEQYGRLGRSYGCLALSPLSNRTIIPEIKNKSCLFIYYPDKGYLQKSRFLSSVE